MDVIANVCGFSWCKLCRLSKYHQDRGLHLGCSVVVEHVLLTHWSCGAQAGGTGSYSISLSHSYFFPLSLPHCTTLIKIERGRLWNSDIIWQIRLD